MSADSSMVKGSSAGTLAGRPAPRATRGVDEAENAGACPDGLLPPPPLELTLAWQRALDQQVQGLAAAAPLAAGGVSPEVSLTVSALQAEQSLASAQAAGSGLPMRVDEPAAVHSAWQANFSTAPGQPWQVQVQLTPASASTQAAAVALSLGGAGVPGALGASQLPHLAQRLRAKGLSVDELAWHETPARQDREAMR